MSTVVLTVELPSLAHSFPVHVSPAATVADLKQRISTSCTGAPLPGGQRLICNGRLLLDHELVQNIWKLKVRLSFLAPSTLIVH